MLSNVISSMSSIFFHSLMSFNMESSKMHIQKNFFFLQPSNDKGYFSARLFSRSRHEIVLLQLLVFFYSLMYFNMESRKMAT